MSYRWSLPETLSAEEKRKARRTLRSSFPDGPPENFDYTKWSKSNTTTGSHSQKSTRTSTNKGKIAGSQTVNVNSSASDDDEEEDEDDNEDSSESSSLIPAHYSQLIRDLEASGLIENKEMAEAYSFYCRKKHVSPTVSEMVQKFEDRWGYAPMHYRQLNNFIIGLGPTPSAVKGDYNVSSS